MKHLKRLVLLALPAILAVTALTGCDTNRTDFLLASTTEIHALPRTGPAWDKVAADANSAWGTPDVHNQDSQWSSKLFAGAVYSNAIYPADNAAANAMREKVLNAIVALTQQTNWYYDGDTAKPNGRTLATGREVGQVVEAADLVTMRNDTVKQPLFVAWLRSVKTHVHSQGHSGGTATLRNTALNSVNNWGAHARATLIAIDVYLGDQQTELAELVNAHQAWMGRPGVPNTLSFGSGGWYGNQATVYGNLAGINGANTTIQGLGASGILPREQDRTIPVPPTPYSGQPNVEGYVWEALQGEVKAAALLKHTGLDVNAFNWTSGSSAPLPGDGAFYLAMVRGYFSGNVLGDVDCNPVGGVADDLQTAYLLNKFDTAFSGPSVYVYDTACQFTTTLPKGVPAGKNMTAADFLFG